MSQRVHQLIAGAEDQSKRRQHQALSVPGEGNEGINQAKSTKQAERGEGGEGGGE